jgi:3-oxoacyl-[acyl-carrier protein] reductase
LRAGAAASTLRGVSGHVVITGGAGGLGRALATAFADAGHEVLAPGRDELEVTDAAAVKDYFKGREVGLLICNAGTTRDALLAKVSGEDWDEVMRVNLRGAALCAAAGSRGMVRARAGHIVFISSHSAIHPPAGQAAYAAAKAGLIGLTMSLAKELGPAGVRVNAVLPGFLETRKGARARTLQHGGGRRRVPGGIARADAPHVRPGISPG